METELQILKLEKGDPIPFDLLLLADETMEAIERYIYDADVYLLRNPAPIGVFALCRLNDAEAEIRNIAVAERFRGQGFGSYMIAAIKEIAASLGHKALWAGTPDTAMKEIAFYRKNGFEPVYTKQHFFTDNYPEPIYEDGILLQHMVMLRTALHT